jgi:hypothetical protein
MAHRDPPEPDEIAPEDSCVICGTLTDNFIDGQPICPDCYDAKLEAEGEPVDDSEPEDELAPGEEEYLKEAPPEEPITEVEEAEPFEPDEDDDKPYGGF